LRKGEKIFIFPDFALRIGAMKVAALRVCSGGSSAHLAHSSPTVDARVTFTTEARFFLA
jgi:hypothetical protein